MEIGSEKPSNDIPSIFADLIEPFKLEPCAMQNPGPSAAAYRKSRGRDVLVVEEILDRFDGHARIEQQRRCRRPERMRRVDALPHLFSVRKIFLLRRAGKSVQIAHEQAVHAAVGHPARSEIVAVPGAARAEEWTALDAGRLDVLGNRLRRAEMNTLGLDVTTFDMKAQRCLSGCRGGIAPGLPTWQFLFA